MCQEGGVKKGGTWRTLGGFLIRDLEDRDILDAMDDLGGPQGSYPGSFRSIYIYLLWSYEQSWSKLPTSVDEMTETRETRERERRERKLKFTITLPSRVEAGVRQG